MCITIRLSYSLTFTHKNNLNNGFFHRGKKMNGYILSFVLFF